MRPKLTQYLIDKGYVTEAQCQEALQRQVVFGGRLGTNLLELCFVSEQQLLEGLSKTLRAPVADLDKLTISQEVLNAFPADLAQKHKVIPIEESKGRLHLAMVEPNNLAAIDEITFITGKTLKTYVASELRLTYLLEEYYGVSRERTFIALPEELEKRRLAWEEKHRQTPVQHAPSSVPAAPPPSAGETAAIELDDLPQPARPAVDRTPQTPAAPASPETAPPQPIQPPPLPEAAPAGPPPLDFSDYDDCSKALADSRNREDIGNVLVEFARSRMDRVILFVVKGDEVRAWRVGGRWESPRFFRSLKFSVKEASVVHHVSRTGETYQGPFLDVPAHKAMLETLGGTAPSEVVAIPLTIRKRVISVLVGDNSLTGRPFGDLQELQKLTLKAAIAFEILILRAKILFR